ncbi:hypothetical protein [Paenibacillus sp. UASWS1643]|uniref:hypothetical protein n=1 Tax=Paenibacillus sp. UASWS1643 TaxID=2580422 RepID=UPI00123C0E80|nr:hypothetical protein [Paenibacillus sp. UASWS1643]KAA8750153.1 hypothetical protein FE296_16295 [Paenibacillus sp. UASWS1643]
MAEYKRLMDPETGEIYDRTAVLADGDRVTSAAQRESYAKKQSGRTAEFTVTQMRNIDEVIERVSDKHCGYLLYLQCFVNYDAILENPDKSAMSREDMMRTLKIGRTTLHHFLRETTEAGVIEEDGDKYRLNPRYHFQGKTDNTAVIKTFVAKVKELYTEVNAKDLGFVYKLLPHVHLETNTICANPYERDVENTLPLTKEDIAQLTRVTEKSVYTKLRNLRFGDQYVFAEVSYGNARYYKINPFVFYRKSGQPDATLREMFSIRNNFAKRSA